MIKGIIFDKDGTLFDFNATWGTWARGMLEAETAGDPVLFARLAEALGYDTDANRFAAGSVVIASTVGEVADVIQGVVGLTDRAALLDLHHHALAVIRDPVDNLPALDAVDVVGGDRLPGVVPQLLLVALHPERERVEV